jgi:hypothetical protein
MVQRLEDGRTIGAPVQLCTTEALATSGLAGQAYDAAPDGLVFWLRFPRVGRPSSCEAVGCLVPGNERIKETNGRLPSTALPQM